MTANLSSIQGCLMGATVGDALGVPFRGLKGGRIKQLFGEVDGFVDARDAWKAKAHRWTLPGLHSGATQMSLSVAECLVQTGHLDMDRIHGLWARLLRAPDLRGEKWGGHRNPSPAMAQRLLAIKHSDEPRSMATTCEAAAAVFPLAIAHMDDPQTLSAEVIEFALSLHRDPRSIAAALVMAHAAAMLLAAETPINTLRIAEQIIERVREGEELMLIEHMGELDLAYPEEDADPLHAMSKALEAVPGLVLEGDINLAIATLVRSGHHLAPSMHGASHTSGMPLVTIPIILQVALAQQRYADPVLQIIGEGKESHLCGAMLGGLLGARVGVGSIPGDWQEALVARDEVLSFADALAGEPSVCPSWIEMEVGFTQREIEARKPVESEAKRVKAKAHGRQPKKAPKKSSPPKGPALPQEIPDPEFPIGDKNHPLAKQRERAARGRKRISWKEERRRQRESPDE